MEDFRILLLLLLAHFIADFPLQTNRINEGKKHLIQDASGYRRKIWHEKISGLLKHLFWHACTLIVTLISIKLSSNVIKVSFWMCVLVFLGILIIHGIMDYIKEYVASKQCLNNSSNKQTIKSQVSWYLGDQLVHIVTIFGGFMFLTGGKYFDKYKIFLQELLLGEKINIDFMLIDKILIVAIIFIINTYVSGYLIGMLLCKSDEKGNLIGSYTVKNGSFFSSNPADLVKKIEVDNQSVLQTATLDLKYTRTFKIQEENQNYGRYIGYLERSLYMILISANKIEGIAFIIAIKAIARYKQFDDKNFAEYYLIGSFLSILIGIINGLILKFVI